MLTPEQLAAATSRAERVFVTAGPGSGKTLTLAARIAHLVEGGADPRTIIAYVFTRAGAAGLRRHVERMHPAAAGVTITTFHAWAAERVVPSKMRVATPIEELALVDSCYSGPTRITGRWMPGRTELVRQIVEHEAHVGGDRRGVGVLIGRAWEAGLVPTWNLVPRLYPWIESTLDSYDHILVDESQDCTSREASLCAALYNRSLFTVGDPRQAIMGFRGGSPESWDDMQDVERHILTRTFRFGRWIAAAANRHALRFGGDAIVGSDAEGHVALCADLAVEVAASPPDAAVLCRTNWECEAIAGELASVEHVTRDPLDPFGSAADRFADVAARGRIPVATVHTAKGREWDRVILPMDLSRDEKDPEWLRVGYVAITRARKAVVFVPELMRQGSPRRSPGPVVIGGLRDGADLYSTGGAPDYPNLGNESTGAPSGSFNQRGPE